MEGGLGTSALKGPGKLQESYGQAACRSRGTLLLGTHCYCLFLVGAHPLNFTSWRAGYLSAHIAKCSSRTTHLDLLAHTHSPAPDVPAAISLVPTGCHHGQAGGKRQSPFSDTCELCWGLHPFPSMSCPANRPAWRPKHELLKCSNQDTLFLRTLNIYNYSLIHY